MDRTRNEATIRRWWKPVLRPRGERGASTRNEATIRRWWKRAQSVVYGGTGLHPQ